MVLLTQLNGRPGKHSGCSTKGGTSWNLVEPSPENMLFLDIRAEYLRRQMMLSWPFRPRRHAPAAKNYGEHTGRDPLTSTIAGAMGL